MIVQVLRGGIQLGVLGALVLGLVRCSDDSKAPAKDTGTSTDSTLWACTEPGKACNAHDACALDAVCGQDHLCHPERRQNCDDGLECTVDSCGPAGQCINTPKENTCALPLKDPKGGPSEVQCFAKGTLNPADPCQVCDPTTSATKWSGVKKGGTCDDGNPCTKDDTCLDGVCSGTYYGNLCADGLECTEDICDGVGGCSHKQKTTYCLIDGKCYKDQETDATGCQLCDVSKNQLKWSTLAELCKIGGLCFKPGTKDGTGCGVCDPARSATGWSAAPAACFIAGVCAKAGDKDATGCGSCDPQKSTSGWTVAAGKCLVRGLCAASGDKSASGCGVCDPAQSATLWSPVSGSSAQTNGFEGSLGGYTVDPPQSGVGWQLSTKRAHSGTGSLYFGNPATSSYDSGAASSGSATGPAVTLPAGHKAALQLWLYADIETVGSADVLQVKVNGTVLWTKDATTMPPTTSYRTWVFVEVSLTAFAGQSVQVSFSFDTKDAWANSGEGVYVDDVAIVTGC